MAGTTCGWRVGPAPGRVAAVDLASGLLSAVPAFSRIRRPRWPTSAALPLVAAAMLWSVAGCSAAGRRAAEEAVAPPTVTLTPGNEARPLSDLASRRVLLLPVQRVEREPGIPAAATAALPTILDAELSFVLAERGLGSLWVTAAAARRMAAQNPGMGLEPAALPLPPPRQLERGPVLEPLSGQLRALAALADARYVIVPTALHLGAAPAFAAAGGSSTTAGQVTRARLMLLLVDVRAAQILWAGSTEVVDLEPAAPAFGATIASRFADLIAAPRSP